MPQQVTSEMVPVTLSIVRFDQSQGEDIYLTYTHGRENGPGIRRDGKRSPSMLNLYPDYPGEFTTNPEGLRLRSWLIQEALRDDDKIRGMAALAAATERGAPPEVLRVLRAYVQENRKLTAHDTEFTRVYPGRNIIGQQGCGDLTMNLWKVAYINSPLTRGGKPALIFLHDEPLASRIYPCFVKWRLRGGGTSVTIEDLRFDSNQLSPRDMVWKWDRDKWVTCGHNIEFAVSSPQVIRNGRVEEIGLMTHLFSDLRHLFLLPNLNPDKILPGVSGDTGHPRTYFSNRTWDDIWFGEALLLDDINLQRAAINGPIFLRREGGGGPSLEQVRGAMELARYNEVADPRAILSPGQYRVLIEDDNLIEVWLRRNVYGWSMIGLNETNDAILCLACEGNPGAQQGHTLEQVVARFQAAGAHNALLIDEGADVFQTALLNRGGAKAPVATGPPDLDITVPRLRTRLRATFLFAKSHL